MVLRDGVIPVLLAYALRDYQNVSLYFHGNEHSYTEEELVKALSEPENYTLFICNWKEEEIAYMVRGFVDGRIPDYQMSAMLMAIIFRE